MASPDATGWNTAIQEELAAVRNATVYEVISISNLPPSANLIGNTWVFKVKQNSDGSVERLKARITAKGCSQKEGIDYQEVFAPVANQTTIRLVIFCLVQRGLIGRSFDVKTAFLYGDLHAHERVYMRVPEGVPNRDKSTCWALQKCIYGLKQSARRFNEHLHSTLTTIGYTRSAHDPCLYINITPSSFTVLVIVVDDILMATSDNTIANTFLANMRETYQMKDLGEPSYTIGIHFERNAETNGYTISQKRYLEDVIARFSSANLPTATIPMPSALRLTSTGLANDSDSPLCDPLMYRSLIGSLMYVLLTRPDVATPISMLARFMHAPRKVHLDSALRVLGYLRTTKDMCLHYNRTDTTKPQLRCYVDSDWAADADTRRSRYGFAIYLGSSLLCWRSKLHSSITLSTAEAEYVAASETAKEILWLRQLTTEIGFPQTSATTMFEDNAACIKMSSNIGVSGRNKHLEVKMHFVRDLVAKNVVKLLKIGTADQRADIFTKNLPRPSFEKHRASLLDGLAPDTTD
jgi:histone deacetylase 1/2